MKNFWSGQSRLFLSCRGGASNMVLITLMWIILMSTTLVHADDYRINGGDSLAEKVELEPDKQNERGENGTKETNEGNEITGQTTAWLFGLANLTVVLSLLIKGTIRLFPLPPPAQQSLRKFIQFQKKHLMKIHYYLNPVALGIALFYFSLSSCPLSPLPELGLCIISLLLILGIILKIKGSPKVIKRFAYKVHTHPIISIILVSIVLTGHLAID
jgi:hypothetical protein